MQQDPLGFAPPDADPVADMKRTARTQLKRRQVAKLIALGTGLGVLDAALPSVWSLPQIGIGTLPAHAQGSCEPDRINSDADRRRCANRDGGTGMTGGGGMSGSSGTTGSAGKPGNERDASTGSNGERDAAVGRDAGMDAAISGNDAGRDAALSTDDDSGTESNLDAGSDASSADAASSSNVPTPANLTAAADSDTSLLVSWDQNASFDFYELTWQPTAGGTLQSTSFMNSGGGVRTHQLTGLTPSTMYQVKLRGQAGCCYGNFATASGAPFQLPKPSAPTIEYHSGDVVVITWNVVTGVDGYFVERSMLDDFGVVDLTQPRAGDTFNTFMDSSSKSPGVYYYRYCIADAGYAQVSQFSDAVAVSV